MTFYASRSYRYANQGKPGITQDTFSPQPLSLDRIGYLPPPPTDTHKRHAAADVVIFEDSVAMVLH